TDRRPVMQEQIMESEKGSAYLGNNAVLTASSYHLETISVQYSTVWNSYLGLNGAFEKERIQYRGQDILK
ncbi:hypothetical protein AAEH90_20815, partial [Shewanella algae]|uniref:hypothetical protein n=1 Tax=Shewanella algae TaxID=38313 RepID=UPI00313CCC6C